jgi:transcriptional regulator with XRE-family HTH domain
MQASTVVQKSDFHIDARASFATAFRNWRRKNKLPLKKVAADLGVSVSIVNLWESGKRFPGGRNFEMPVDYTGLPPCKLFCVMADKCVPTDCLLALHRLGSKPA